MLRAKRRSLLVLVMVLLPVTAVAALSTLLRTADVDAVEALPSSLGPASARLDVSSGRVQQDPFLRTVGQYEQLSRPTEEQVREAYDALRLVDGDRGRRVTPVAVDLRDGGPFHIADGRAPTGPDEIVVAPSLTDVGVRVGDRVELRGQPRTVTGVVDAPRDVAHGDAVYGLPAAVGLEDAPVTRWYALGPPVTWEDVQELNVLGVAVLSRAVVLDPPPADQVVEQPYADDSRRVTLAIVALITVMAVLEVSPPSSACRSASPPRSPAPR